MLFRHIVLRLSAFVMLFVSGCIAFDLGQDVIDGLDGGDSTTITLKTTATGSRPADFAIVNVFATGVGMTEDNAWIEGRDLANNVESTLSRIKRTNPRLIVSWKRSENCRQTRNYAFDQHSLHSDGYFNTAHVATLFSVRFHNFDYFNTLLTEIMSEPGTGVNRISWELTEETLEDLKPELWAKTLSSLVDQAEDYAKALGRTDVQPLQCQTFWVHIEENVTENHWHKENTQDAPQEVEVEARMECKFEIA